MKVWIITAIILMVIMSGCSSLYDADGGWTENQIEERQA